MSRFTIVGLGEALYDIFGQRQILGGAPLNVAVHAHQLGSVRGGRGVVVSRVGQDDLGRSVSDELRRRGMTTNYLQTDPDHDSGRVYVSVDAGGQPEYDIVQDVAWDWIQFDPDVEDLARRCEAVCFGTLVQRNSQSRNTIYRMLDACKPRSVRLLDVNLRQEHFDRNILQRSLECASAVKLNEQELDVLNETLSVGAADSSVDACVSRLISAYDLRLLALTRGACGTVIYTPANRHEGPPVLYDPAPDADAVGAGDACAAAIALGMILGWPPERTVKLANHAGAYVASRPGGTPELPDVILEMAKD